MSDKQWIEDVSGMYVRTPSRGAFRGEKLFCGRVWVKSEGKFKHFVLGTALKKAKDRLREIQLKPELALEEKHREAVRLLTVSAVAEEFLAGYRSRGGTDYYRNVMKAPLKFFGQMPASRITAADVDRYLQMRRSEKIRIGERKGKPKIGESTLRKEVLALQKALRWGKARTLVPSNPLADYERPKQPAGPAARALTYEEEDRLLALLPPLERDVVAWALDSAMRRGEILALTWPRIDRASGVIHVVETKTGKARMVPLDLSDRLIEILGRRPQRTNTALLFHDLEGKALDVDRLNGMLEAAMKAAGVPKTRGALWNVLRKTWVSRFYANGGLPQKEADIAGHSMGVADKHYRDFSPAARLGSSGLLNRQEKIAVPPTVPRSGRVRVAGGAS